MPRARPWFLMLAWAGMIAANSGTVSLAMSDKPYAMVSLAVMIVAFNICLWHIVGWAMWGWLRRNELDRLTDDINRFHREAAEAVVGLRATARTVHKRLGLDDA